MSEQDARPATEATQYMSDVHFSHSYPAFSADLVPPVPENASPIPPRLQKEISAVKSSKTPADQRGAAYKRVVDASPPAVQASAAQLVKHLDPPAHGPMVAEMGGIGAVMQRQPAPQRMTSAQIARN